jgi:hypothetical protein
VLSAFDSRLLIEVVLHGGRVICAFGAVLLVGQPLALRSPIVGVYASLRVPPDKVLPGPVGFHPLKISSVSRNLKILCARQDLRMFRGS